MPVVPYLCVFAAAAFFYWWDEARRWKLRGLVLRFVALAALFLYCDADPFEVARRSQYESQAHYSMGTIYLSQGNLDAAEAEYLAALDAPDSIAVADSLNDLGIIAARRGDTDKAEEYFKRAASGQPGYSKAYNNLGNLARDAGDAAAAREYYELALTADPEDARAYYFLGRLLADEGDPEGAAARFERATYYQPNFSSAWYERGKLARAEGDFGAAAEYFREALHFAPASTEARGALADALHQAGDYAGAEREYRYLLAVTDDPRAHYNLACTLARQGRDDEAMAELTRAITLAPERYRPMAVADGDLAPLRGRPDFENLVSR
jgi:tetratricopeptide (TPR) repeat protein